MFLGLAGDGGDVVQRGDGEAVVLGGSGAARGWTARCSDCVCDRAYRHLDKNSLTAGRAGGALGGGDERLFGDECWSGRVMAVGESPSFLRMLR